MTILDKIIADKKKEVNYKKSVIPLQQLQNSVLFDRNVYSLSKNLKNSNSGIIAEHKRRSPSKSVINQSLNCFDVVQAYQKAGVCGISVLTDGKYFGGSLDDLLVARANCQLPLLRKDFVIDAYQIYEAKAFGADVVLLIASVLTKQELKTLSNLAKELGLEVLLEVHNQEELEKSVSLKVDLIGVNNRNLKTFEVDINHSKILAKLIPDTFVKVSESGISNVRAIKELRPFGYKGFLIGENFMKTNAIDQETQKFIKKIEADVS